MKKSYFKGLATGLILAAALAGVSVFAVGSDLVFNDIRINLNGFIKAQKGDSYMLDNGSEVPYSILYNGTTYLPLRKIGELYDKQVFWNGDTGTATITEQFDYPNKANADALEELLAEEPDANNNMWAYIRINDVYQNGYLHIYDMKRQFSRVYYLGFGQLRQFEGSYQLSTTSYAVVVDDGIIISTRPDFNTFYNLVKFEFKSNADTQDGVVISEGQDCFIFDDLMIAFGTRFDENDVGFPVAEAINLKTGNKADIGQGDYNGSIDGAFAGVFDRIHDNPTDYAEYKDGYLYFDSYETDYNSDAPIIRHHYRVKIEMADTPVTGGIEDLGAIE